jgi:hypothetical protein
MFYGVIYAAAAGLTFFFLDTRAQERRRRHNRHCQDVACPGGCAGPLFTVSATALLGALGWPVVWLAFLGAGIDAMVRAHYEKRPQGADK